MFRFASNKSVHRQRCLVRPCTHSFGNNAIRPSLQTRFTLINQLNGKLMSESESYLFVGPFGTWLAVRLVDGINLVLVYNL